MSKTSIEYFFEKDSIVFENYPLLHSTVKKVMILKRENIIGVDLYTWPVSVITSGKEIVFLSHDKKTKDELQKFAVENKLKIVDRLDVWEIICRPFLDTEFPVRDEEYQTLKSYGIDRPEIEEARRRIKRYFLFTMEWQYIGQWDVLMSRQRYVFQTFLYRYGSQDFYWWTMELATRGL